MTPWKIAVLDRAMLVSEPFAFNFPAEVAEYPSTQQSVGRILESDRSPQGKPRCFANSRRIQESDLQNCNTPVLNARLHKGRLKTCFSDGLSVFRLPQILKPTAAPTMYGRFRGSRG